MQIITKREKIRSVLNRWLKQYPEQNQITTTKLRELDLNNCSADDIANIIGNSSWTSLYCNECEKDVDIIMGLGKDDDKDPSVYVCECCLAGALAQFKYLRDR